MDIIYNCILPAIASLGLFIVGSAFINMIRNNYAYGRKSSDTAAVLLYAAFSAFFAFLPLVYGGSKLTDMRFIVLIYVAQAFEPLYICLFAPLYILGALATEMIPVFNLSAALSQTRGIVPDLYPGLDPNLVFYHLLPYILSSVYCFAVAVVHLKKDIKAALMIAGTIPIVAAGVYLSGAVGEFEGKTLFAALTLTAAVIAAITVAVVPASRRNILGTNTFLSYAASLLGRYRQIHRIILDKKMEAVRCTAEFRREYEISGYDGNRIPYEAFREIFSTGTADNEVAADFEKAVLSHPQREMAFITPKTGRYKYISMTFSRRFFGGWAGLIRDMTDSIEPEAILHLISRKDFTTGLKSHNVMKEELVKLARYNPGLMLQACMDISHTGIMESVSGKEFDNKCLRAAAEMLKKEFGEAFIYSTGPNEMQMVFFSLDRNTRAADYVNRIKRIYKSPVYIEERRVFFIPTMGVKISETLKYTDIESIDSLISRVAWAKEKALKTGRGSVYYFNEKDYKEALEHYKRGQILPGLISEGEFYPVFQPIVSVADGTVFAYEVLTRVKNLYYKSVSQLIEDSLLMNLGNELDTAIIGKIRTCITENNISSNIFLNKLTGTPIIEDINVICEFLSGRGKNLYIEFTEYDKYDVEDLVYLVSQLSAKGMKVVIDDYGEANSSPILLSSINPAVVKIDRNIINGIHNNRKKEFMLKGILEYCRHFGIVTIAEGVSDAKDLTKVIGLGIDYVQGFLIGMPAESPGDISAGIRNEILRMKGNVD